MRSEKTLLGTEIEKLQLKMKELQIDHAGEVADIEMCRKLRMEFKYGNSTIRYVFDLAEKYGEPHNVFEALSEYGSVAGLRKEKIQLKNEIELMKAERQELTTQLERSKGEINALVVTVKSTVKELLENVAVRMQEAGRFEDELKLARVFKAAITFSAENKKMAIQHAMTFLAFAGAICMATQVNPRVFKDTTAAVMIHFIIEQLSKELGSLV